MSDYLQAVKLCKERLQDVNLLRDLEEGLGLQPIGNGIKIKD